MFKSELFNPATDEWLKPDDSHKSFYGAAFVRNVGDGSKSLFSYDTEIIHITPDGEKYRVWEGSYVLRNGPFWTKYEEWTEWTATTGRHIRAFCGLNKKEFMKLPILH